MPNTRHKPKPTVASLKRQLKAQQHATTQRQEALQTADAELQTALSNQRRLNRELTEQKQQTLDAHNLAQSYAEGRARDTSHNHQLSEQLKTYADNSFVVEVNVRRGNTKQVSNFAFVKGEHSLQLIVDSGGSVRSVLGDIGQMRSEVAHEPLHIHRQDPLTETVTHERVGDVAQTRVERTYRDAIPHGAGAGAPNGKGGVPQQ